MSAAPAYCPRARSPLPHDGLFARLLPITLRPHHQDLSAAAVLETLYFYALAHQNDFDVCWPRGSIAELIFKPLVERIRSTGRATQAGNEALGRQETGGSGRVAMTW